MKALLSPTSEKRTVNAHPRLPKPSSPVQLVSPTVTRKVKLGWWAWPSALRRSYTGVFPILVPYSCRRLIGVLPGLAASICSILREGAQTLITPPLCTHLAKHCHIQAHYVGHKVQGTSGSTAPIAWVQCRIEVQAGKAGCTAPGQADNALFLSGR